MTVPRALPPNPSLEFEKKSAKSFLRQLREGEAEARSRAEAQHTGLGARPREEFQLADAHLVIAREYGFASWPKLVRYFEDLDRQRRGRRTPQFSPITRHMERARSRLAAHAQQQLHAGRAFAAYAPRFYGLPLTEVFKLTPTLEEAYLVEARSHGESSWESLAARESTENPDIAKKEVNAAIGASDLPRLQRVLAERPDLLTLPDLAAANGWRIGKCLVHHERRMEPGRLTPILEWLATLGFDYARELGLQLCGHMQMKVEKVRWLLERGVDPNWLAPNGIPALEHALLLYWNGAAVDLVAARAKPRQALWIAAGLGDVRWVERSLDGKGHPTAEAVALRPPFDMVGGPAITPHPEPSVEELLMEALFVAASNGRIGVIKYLASRGAPIDSRIYGGTLLSVAVGNGWADVVEALLEAGADLDIPTGDSNGTPREMGRTFFQPNDPARQRIRELCDLAPRTGAR